MSTPYELLRRPLLPVVRADGRRVDIRLADITSPHEGHALLRLDSGRPDIDTSLAEFVIGLLAIALDPIATDIRWIERWKTPPSNAELERAFEPFASALVLDGPGPRFFQDLEEIEGAEESIAALFMDAPAEHFVKPGGIATLSRRGAALALLTLQTSAPSGGRGHRTGLRGGGPLTTLIVPGAVNGNPPTLWQRLWANVPEEFGARATDIKLVFPWTAPTRTSEKGAATFETPPDFEAGFVHKAHAFFGMPRRIRLKFEANKERIACDLTGEIDEVIVKSYITKSSGNNYVGWGKFHPLSPCYRPKPKEPDFLPMHLQSARIGYRDWLGYVFAEPDGSSLPARTIDTFYKKRAATLRRIDPAITARARLQASAMVLENMKPLEYGEALLPLPVVAKDLPPEQEAEALQATEMRARSMVLAAEVTAGVLGAAVRRGLYGDARDVNSAATTLDAAKDRLWADTERAFYERIADPEFSNAHGRHWLAALRKAALAIFDDVVPLDSADARSLDHYRQIVEARGQLRAAFDGITPKGRDLFKALHLEPAKHGKEPKRKKGGADEQRTV